MFKVGPAIPHTKTMALDARATPLADSGINKRPIKWHSLID